MPGIGLATVAPVLWRAHRSGTISRCKSPDLTGKSSHCQPPKPPTPQPPNPATPQPPNPPTSTPTPKTPTFPPESVDRICRVETTGAMARYVFLDEARLNSPQPAEAGRSQRSGAEETQKLAPQVPGLEEVTFWVWTLVVVSFLPFRSQASMFHMVPRRVWLGARDQASAGFADPHCDWLRLNQMTPRCGPPELAGLRGKNHMNSGSILVCWLLDIQRRKGSAPHQVRVFLTIPTTPPHFSNQHSIHSNPNWGKPMDSAKALAF